MSGPEIEKSDINVDVITVILLLVAFITPVIVLPDKIHNIFETPKDLVILSGVLIMIGIYAYGFFSGNSIQVYSNPTLFFFIFLIALNLFSFFYTENFYFTMKAALLNISCLFIYLFVSLNTQSKRSFLLVSVIALSGLVVAMETWFQFFGHPLLIRRMQSGSMVMGTIGNSNYLGAYMLFPLFAMTVLCFLLKARYRIIPVILAVFMLTAFLFSRARAGWFGFFPALIGFLFLVKTIYSFSIREYLRRNLIKAVFVFSVVVVFLIALGLVAPDRFHNLISIRNVTNPRTLMLRMNKYIPPSMWLIKQSPVFGTGLWSYRSMVYEGQAEINLVDPEYFENYPSPKPRRVHNEYLEILNDGGLVAAISLLFFLLIIMKHGWNLIRDDEAVLEDRVITAMCFCSIIAIMLTSFFFFSFRLNSTMLMTVLMLGLMEGIYLRKNQLIRPVKVSIPGTGPVMFFLIFILLSGVLWFGGVRPFMAEREHFNYETSLERGDVKSAEEHILKAVELDPHNSIYLFYTAQLYFNIKRDFVKASQYIERAIIDFNGDVTLYGAYYFKGLIKYNMGSLFEAKESFEKALYYNPTFEQAKDKLSDLNKVMKEHDSVTIKFK